MKEKSIRIRLSERRYLKLKAYADAKEKTMTQVVEDWIDRLQLPKVLEASVPPDFGVSAVPELAEGQSNASRSQSPP